MKTRIKSQVRKTAVNAMLLAIALILSYIESLIPIIIIPIPGVKLGFANIIVMLIFFYIGRTDAFIVSILRVLLISVLFGNVSSLWFSLSGAVFAYLILCLSAKIKPFVSYIGISILCASAHNSGQVIAASVMFKSCAVFSYLPWLLLMSIPVGFITGLIMNIIGRYELSKKLLYR